MPDWTYVHMSVRGPADQIDEIAAIFRWRPFDRLIPMPEELAGPIAESEAARTELKRKYGHPDRHEWRSAHWGTKWEARAARTYRRDADRLDVTFQSAWDFPYPVIEALCKRFADCTITVEANSWRDSGHTLLKGWNDKGAFGYAILYNANED